MWLIGELENDKVPPQIDASAIPKNWLLVINGKLHCLWPKTNAGPKIRSCAKPETDWNTYKCRILMDGELFKTYQEAREAEKISENFSTLTAYTRNRNKKRLRNELDHSETKIAKMMESNVEECTMKNTFSRDMSPFSDNSEISFSYDSDASFSDDSKVEVIGNDSFEYNEGVKYGGTYMLENNNSNEDVSSFSDDSKVELVGNDSFEYNEGVKYGGTYILENNNSNEDVQLNEVKTFPENEYDLKSPQESDFSITFAKEAGMLTSTLLDYESPKFNDTEKTQMAADINSQISKIEVMISSFVKNVGHELQLLKQLVEVQSTSGVVKGAAMSSEVVKSLEKKEEKVGKSDSLGIKVLDIIVLNAVPNVPNVEAVVDPNVPNTETVVDPNVENMEVANAPNAAEKVVDPNVDNLIILNVSNAEKVIDLNVENLNVANAPNAKKVVVPNVEYLNILNVPNAVKAVNPNVGDSNAASVSNDKRNIDLNVTYDQVPKPQVNLPTTCIDHYKEIELLFDEDDSTSLEQALIEHLLPIDDETEAKYMDRTIETLFTPQFFIDYISWKSEEKRINISKGSHILECWKKSHETKFKPDDDNSRFKIHFRRYKSAKRAAMKAKERKNNLRK